MGLLFSFLLIFCFLESYWHAASQPLSDAVVQWCNGMPTVLHLGMEILALARARKGWRRD
jgi:hypothetical protein